MMSGAFDQNIGKLFSELVTDSGNIAKDLFLCSFITCSTLIRTLYSGQNIAEVVARFQTFDSFVNCSTGL